MIEQNVSNPVSRLYEKKAAVYDTFVQRAVIKLLLSKVPKKIFELNSDLLLNIGFGTGLCDEVFRNLFPVLQDAKTVGIDLSLQMLHVAQSKPNDHALLVQADANELPFENNVFSGLVSTFTFCHLKDPYTVFADAVQTLKPNAPVVISDVREPYPQTKTPHRLFAEHIYQEFESYSYATTPEDLLRNRQFADALRSLGLNVEYVHAPFTTFLPWGFSAFGTITDPIHFADKVRNCRSNQLP